MDCPTCGVPGFIGASICTACGSSLFLDRNQETGAIDAEAPPETVALFPERRAPAGTGDAGPGDADATRPLDFEVATLVASVRAKAGTAAAVPGPAPAATRRCSLCLEPFEAVPGRSAAICASCSSGEEAAGPDAGLLLDGDLPYPTHEAPAPRRTRSTTPVAPRAGLRGGVLAAFAGVLVVGSVGVVSVLEPEADPFADALVGVRSDPAALRVLVPGKESLRFETRSDVHVVYEAARPGSTDLRPRLDVRSATVGVTRLGLLERRRVGDLLHASSECRAESEVVREGNGRKVDRRVYPWDGHEGDVRLLLPPSGPPEIVGGGTPVAGRDLPPLFSLSATGTGPRAVEPGDHWGADVPLPLLADREGRVSVHPFQARFTYLGRLVAHGRDCLVVRMRARVSDPLPPSLRRMDDTRGVIEGLLHYDSHTGLLVRGELLPDLTLSRTNGGGGERLRITGCVTVTGP